MAIALIHVLPEEIEAWAEYSGMGGEAFPLPEVLCFAGYTIILVLDKVLFDTHALFDHDDDHPVDPADAMLQKNVRASMARIQSMPENATTAEIKASQVELRASMNQTVKDYLNPNERFAERMKRSMRGPTNEEDVDGQQQLFVSDAKIVLKGSMNESSNSPTVHETEGLMTAHQHVEEVKKSSSCNLTPFILMIALSVHSCFEGLAAGL